jgi:hypothetical protein
MEIILAFFALFTKHFIVDFPLQRWPYLYENKGTYGHPGGLIHASAHIIGSFVALVWFVPLGWLLIAICIFDGVVHYHIDYVKMNITKRYEFKCNKDAEFWVLLGVDQYLHYATYTIMIAFLLK